MKKYNLFSLILVFCLISSTALHAKELAFVSILPQKFLVQSIAGDLLDVKVLVKPGQSPELFDPTPRQMAELSKAKLFFTIGLNFEQVILDRIIANNIQLKLIETQKGIKEQSYGGDPHIWLDPILVKQQIKTIYLALIKQFPEHKDSLLQRHTEFLQNLNQLNDYLLKIFSTGEISKLKSNSFVIFHPALSYFSRRYDLNQIAIEPAGHKNSAKNLANLISDLKLHTINYILVEKQFSKKEAKTIAKVLNAQLLQIDPLAESWINNMYELADRVHQSLF